MIGYEPDELHGGISGRVVTRPVTGVTEIVREIRSWKFSGWLDPSNEHHDPAN
jgi:hypothetical protein